MAGPASFAELRKHPVDGFSAGLVDDDNLLEWEIMIMGCVVLAVSIHGTGRDNEHLKAALCKQNRIPDLPIPCTKALS